MIAGSILLFYSRVVLSQNAISFSQFDVLDTTFHIVLIYLVCGKGNINLMIRNYQVSTNKYKIINIKKSDTNIEIY